MRFTILATPNLNQEKKNIKHTVPVMVNSDHLLGASGRGTDVLKRMLATKEFIHQIRMTYFRDHLRTCREPSHYRFLG